MDPNNTDDQKHWSLKVFEDCPIGMALSTADFRFTRVNEALCTMMGYEENELLKLTFKEITHPDHFKEDSENIKRLFNGEIPVYHTEKRYIRKDGSIIWGALKISIISDDTGNFRFFLAMVENITERKQIEMELQRSEKKFKAIFEKSIDAILLTSPDGKIYDVNPQACKLFGMSKEQICSGGRSAILDIADPRLPEAIAERERTGSFYGELTGKKSDGTRFPVEISSVIFFEDSGEQRTSMIMRDLSERNKVEAQLRESEQYLSSIYDTVGDVIFVLKVEPDGNYCFDSVNKTFTQVTGLSTEQVVGKLVTEVIPEPSLTMVLGKYRQSITEKRVAQWEEISDYPTGKLFGEVKVAPLFDMDGKCTHLVGSVHDITKRKWSENALKESEELYRNLVDKIPDGLYKSTHEGKFVMVNPALVKMLGYDSEEELLSIDIKSQLYFDLSDRESHVLDEHQEEIGVFPLRKKDGSALWVEDHGWYNLDENGEILFHEGIVRDISERIQAEEKRKRSELEYKTLFENANDAIMIMNREKFTECNLMTLKMFGCNCKEDIVDHFPWEFSQELQPDGQLSTDKARGLIEKAMTGEPQRFYWKHHRLDGTLFDADVSLNRIDFGSSFRIQAIVRDITRQKQDELEKARLNAELKDLNATKDRFFSIIAHDLRSPFNALLGLTQMISNPDEKFSLEETRTISGRVHGMLVNQFNFLQNLLEWSRIQQGRYGFQPEKINFAEVASIVIVLLSGNCIKKQIEVINRIKDPFLIEADPEMIKSVLLNLLSNAIKFTPRNGRIELEATSQNGDSEILIRDSGTGIGDAELEKLFRLDTVFTKNGTEGEKGTGLGLILCREMIKRHGGTICITSRVGEGTTVRLIIPERTPD